MVFSGRWCGCRGGRARGNRCRKGNGWDRRENDAGASLLDIGRVAARVSRVDAAGCAIRAEPDGAARVAAVGRLVGDALDAGVAGQRIGGQSAVRKISSYLPLRITARVLAEIRVGRDVGLTLGKLCLCIVLLSAKRAIATANPRRLTQVSAQTGREFSGERLQRSIEF